MIEFPSFEFVIVDKNTKGKGETSRSQRHIWKPFCSSVEREDENPTKVRNPASRKVGLTYLWRREGVLELLQSCNGKVRDSGAPAPYVCC